jgi:hypothetical protein
MPKPIFLLGLGNTKSGTTWLHHHLVNHHETAFHLNLTKEYNLIESGYAHRRRSAWNPPKWRRLLRYRQWEWSRKLQGKPVTSPDEQVLFGLPRNQFLAEFAQYGAMHSVLLRQSLRFAVVGDISPNNILQPPEKINALIQSLREDFDVRGVMMWRDPLDRMESLYKHGVRANYNLHKRAFSKALAGDDFTELSMFSQLTALKRLSHLDLEPHHILYEELFSPEGQAVLDSFHDFFALEPKAGRFNQTVNDASPDEAGFTPEQRQTLAQALQPEYTELAHFFGETRLRAIWDFPFTP